MALRSAPSSPDPLAPSPASSSPDKTPVRRSRRSAVKAKTILGPSSPNLNSSPSRSFIVETGKNVGAKPLRIKVTVEAEPRSIVSDEEKEDSLTMGKTTTTTVQLKDAEHSSPVKRRGRPRKSVDGSSSAVAGSKKRRASTPAKRKTRGSLVTFESGCRATDTEYPHIGDEFPTHAPPTPPRRRGRPRKSDQVVPSDNGDTDIASSGRVPRSSPPAPPRRRGKSRKSDHIIRPVDSNVEVSLLSPLPESALPVSQLRTPLELYQMERDSLPPVQREADASNRDSTPPDERNALESLRSKEVCEMPELRVDQVQTPEDSALTNANGLASSKLEKNETVRTTESQEDEEMWRTMAASTTVEGSASFDDDAENEDDEDDAVAGVFGDATMLESEGFSMVSVDSLRSGRGGPGSSPDLENFSLAAASRNADSGPRRSADNNDESPTLGTSRRSEGLNSTCTPSHLRSSPPTCPPSIQVEHVSHTQLPTPRLAKVVSTGVALQGMIKSPEKLATSTALSPEQPSNKLGSFFIGFGDRTRRELKAGLHLGERLARHAGESGDCSLHKENSLTSDHLSLKSPLDLPAQALPDEENIGSSSASYFQTIGNPTHAAHPGLSSDPLLGKSAAASSDVFECPPLVQVRSPSYPRLPTPDATQEGYALGVPPSLTQVEHPTLNTKLQQTHLSPARIERSVDAMSWRASSPPVYIRDDHESVKEQTVHVDSPDLPYPFDKIGRRQRRAVLNELDAMSPSKIVVINSDDEPIHCKVEEAGEDDIRQQEGLKASPIASSPPTTQRAAHQNEDEPVQRQPHLEDLFAHEGPPIPRRGKLPRTWRRVSANDFHYSDSPEPEEAPQRKLLSRHNSSGSQTLTPPSTEDEEGPEEGEVSEVEQDDTELQEDDREGATSADESTTTSPDDAEDTGMFWQSNLPTVSTRPRRERPQLRNRNLDLTTLLGLHDSPANALRSSPVQGCAPSGPFQDAPRFAPAAPPDASPLRMRPLEGTFKHSPSKSSAAISTPLRNSLLRSSKVRSSPTYTKQAKSSPLHKAASRTNVGEEEEEILQDAEDGGASEREMCERGVCEEESSEQDNIDQSMASDTRQLYAEMNQHQQFDNNNKSGEMDELVQNPRGRYETQEITITHRLSIETTRYHGTNFSKLDDDGDDSDGDLQDNDEVDEEDDIEEDDITEHAASPQQQIKIPVKFNDSSDLHAASTGDLLAPKKSYPSLFGTIPSSKTHSEPTRPTSTTAPPPAPTGGIFSRLSSTFWSAVTSTSTSATTTTDTTRPATRPAPTSPAGNTAALRAKYGTLTCYAPWTIAHYRILHRMYRATVRQPLYFAPPSAGGPSQPRLRKELKVLLGRECRTPHFTSTWTLPDLYLIDAFVSLLVEPDAHNARGLWLMDEVLPPGPEGKKGSERALGGGGGLAEDGMRLREWDVAVRLHFRKKQCAMMRSLGKETVSAMRCNWKRVLSYEFTTLCCAISCF